MTVVTVCMSTTCRLASRGIDVGDGRLSNSRSSSLSAFDKLVGTDTPARGTAEATGQMIDDMRSTKTKRRSSEEGFESG